MHSNHVMLKFEFLTILDQKKKLDCIDNETVESLKTYASKCNTVYSEDFNEKLKEIERSFRKSAGQMSTKSKQSEFVLELSKVVLLGGRRFSIAAKINYFPCWISLWIQMLLGKDPSRL